MDKPTVLLARPHTFIEKPMSALLIDLGFAPAVVLSIDTLDTEHLQAFRGSVISTSILSHVKQSYVDVLKGIHTMDASMPVMFATLAPLDQMVKKINNDLAGMDIEQEVLCRMNKDLLTQIKSGESQYILVQKPDLDDPSFKETLSECIQFLFRPRPVHISLKHAS